MTDQEVLEIFRDTGALLEGHFQLRSGMHSRQYFQCALVLQHPKIAARLCGALAEKLNDAGAEAVVSPALGGILIGHEVARALGVRHIFVEKNPSGKLELRRSFTVVEGEKFVVVEDVITQGGRVQETIEIVRQKGGTVVAVGAIVDRSEGKVDFGVRKQSLLELPVETYEEVACPICKEGLPLVKPGS